jgi:hypothetical protein
MTNTQDICPLCGTPKSATYPCRCGQLRDTPRTDEIVECLCGSDSQPLIDFARRLERELNEANKKRAEDSQALCRWKQCAEELATATTACAEYAAAMKYKAMKGLK